MGSICKPPVLRAWNGRRVGVTEIPPRKECLGLGATSLGLQVLSPHRGKEVACLAHPPGMGPLFPILLRTVPKPRKARCPSGGRRSGKEIGSESVPAPAGTVRVVHGEWVGLRVEYPVFQGERVIFREQKIEIPVPPGREERQENACQCSGDPGTLRERISGPQACG